MRTIFAMSLWLFGFPCNGTRATYTGNDPDACKSIEHLVVSKGYPFESHTVETEDGYIIEMHRIPKGRVPSSEPGQPVFVMTGLGADSSIFVFDFPGQSLGFVLADDGYDVWLGNTRGSTYGKHHNKLNVKSKHFWDFSFHEHGVFDAPAQIDYVLNATGSRSLLYIGMSQGTLIFFTMMSERPEYNSKLAAWDTPIRPRLKLPGCQETIAPDTRDNDEGNPDAGARVPGTSFEHIVANGEHYNPKRVIRSHWINPTDVSDDARPLQLFFGTPSPEVRVFAGLAPYNKLAHLTLPGLKKTTPFHDNILKAWHSIFKPEVSARSWSSVVAARTLCAMPSRAVCVAFADVINAGSKYLNQTRLVHFRLDARRRLH